MKIHGNLVTGCHDCIFAIIGLEENSHCAATNEIIETSYDKEIVDKSCPMLQEETHSITIMLSDQYNKDENNKINSRA